MRLTGVFVAIVAVGLLVGWLIGFGDAAVAEMGAPAPDFDVELIDGGSFALSDTSGTTVVINLWASWCLPCRDEIPAISAYANENPEITVVGIAVDDPAEADTRAFAAEVGATYPLALDTDDVTDKYPHFGLPATYVLDSEGVVRAFHNGVVDDATLTALVAEADPRTG